MKLRSSLSSLTARLPRYAREVNPAPKSSTETPKPWARSCSITDWQPPKSRMIVVSVISRIRQEGGRWWLASKLETCSMKVGSSRLVIEILTETVSFRPAARQAAH